MTKTYKIIYNNKEDLLTSSFMGLQFNGKTWGC